MGSKKFNVGDQVIAESRKGIVVAVHDSGICEVYVKDRGLYEIPADDLTLTATALYTATYTEVK